LRVDRARIAGEARWQHRALDLHRVRSVRIPAARRPVRELAVAAGRDPDRADVSARCRERAAPARHGGRRSRPDRLRRSGRARRQERDPDRRVRAPGRGARPRSVRRGRRGGAHAAAPDPHDLVRFHPRGGTAHARHRGRRRDAPVARHRRVLRHARRDPVRAPVHAGVLRGLPAPRPRRPGERRPPCRSRRRGCGAMSLALPSGRTSWREWLLSDTPGSRHQARLGRAYLAWLSFARNPLAMVGLGIVLALLVVAALAPLLATHSPIQQTLADRLQPPSAEHWLGTDELGRDIYSRIVYGSRLTLYIVGLVVLLVGPVGLLVGTVAGYVGGWVDTVLMRITDVFLAFPRLILALAFVAALGPGIENAIIAIAITAWPPYARIARAETITVRNA